MQYWGITLRGTFEVTMMFLNLGINYFRERAEGKIIFKCLGIKVVKENWKIFSQWYVKPPWRNGLACWTSNSKVVGSSPTGGEIFPFENTQSLLFKITINYRNGFELRIHWERVWFTSVSLLLTQVSLRFTLVSLASVPISLRSFSVSVLD